MPTSNASGHFKVIHGHSPSQPVATKDLLRNVLSDPPVRRVLQAMRDESKSLDKEALVLVLYDRLAKLEKASRNLLDLRSKTPDAFDSAFAGFVEVQPLTLSRDGTQAMTTTCPTQEVMVRLVGEPAAHVPAISMSMVSIANDPSSYWVASFGSPIAARRRAPLSNKSGALEGAEGPWGLVPEINDLGLRPNGLSILNAINAWAEFSLTIHEHVISMAEHPDFKVYAQNESSSRSFIFSQPPDEGQTDEKDPLKSISGTALLGKSSAEAQEYASQKYNEAMQRINSTRPQKKPSDGSPGR